MSNSKHFPFTRTRCCALLLPALLLAGQPAAAAELEEIIVSVRQRAESIKDVPGTVTAFSADVIQQAGIERARDFIALTPGVSIVNAAEVADSQVNIRGINGARDAETNYALVIDGILLTNPAALNREYTNLRQIEILKGPRGAIYGRNAAAGAFVITTQEPGEDWGGSGKISVAEDSTYLVSGDVGGALSDTLRLGITGSFRDTDGYYRNSYVATQLPGRDDAVVDDAQNWDIGARLIWQPNDRLKVDSKLRYGEVDGRSIIFNSVFHLPALAGFLGPAAYQNVNTWNFQFDNNILSSNDQETTEFSVKVDYDLGWADLTAWGLYSNIDNSLSADGTSGAFQFFNDEPNCQATTAALEGYPVAPPTFIGATPGTSLLGAYSPTSCDGTQYQERNQEDYSFEVRLASKTDQRLRWLAGIYYLNLEREVGVNTGIDRGFGVTERLYVPALDANNNPTSNPTEALVHDRFDTDVYAVFGQLAYDLTDTIEASLALRYDREERESKSLVPTDAVTQYIDTCGGFDGGGDPINPGLCFGTLSPQDETFDAFQPKLSLTWDATDQLTAFTSVGVGFKSGGFNNGGSAATVDVFINSLIYGTGDPDDPGTWDGFFSPGSGTGPDGNGFAPVLTRDIYDEETSISYELGLKGEFLDRRLRTEASIYYVDVDDMQFFEFFVGSFGLLRVVSNIDEVEIKGIELGASFAATDWLDLYAGFNRTNSEIKKAAVRPDSVGNDSPYTPEWTGNLGARVNFPMNETLSFVGSVDVSMIGDTWFHVIQQSERPSVFSFVLNFPVAAEYSINKRDAYQTLNLRAGVAADNWSIVGFINNALDENYLEEVIPAVEFGGSFIHPGSERRLGVEATFKF